MNTKVSLIRYANVPGKGWRRGAAIVGKTGRVKPDYMLLGGVEIHCPNGRYQMRHFAGTRAVYTELGGESCDAMDRFRAAQSTAKAKIDAKRAGLEIVTPSVQVLKSSPRKSGLKRR